MVRCKGITKTGKQCQVTDSSSWVDDSGRLVAAPLCRGGDFCAFHAKPFCVKPILLDNFESMVVFILDLETTGIDIVQDRVVEIAATRAHWDVRMNSECFATTVRVDQNILLTRGLDAFKVHGITNEEIAAGPTFEQAWIRFVAWVVDVTNNATAFAESDSDDEMSLPMILEEPIVVMVAHNGFNFDFPLLLCELLRNSLSTTMFEQWYFVDTLHVFKDLNQYGCIKLQCLARDTMTDPGHAHRALDDCIALREITNIFAQRIGASIHHLLSYYLVELDLASSIAQLTVLM